MRGERAWDTRGGRAALPGGGEDRVDQGVALVPCLQQEDVSCGQAEGTASAWPPWPCRAQRHLYASHPGEHSRSSSKYVSAPSAPGTAQTSRAFRNVVHLFTRLLCPPTSFCGARGSRWVSGGARTPGTPAPACTHPADLADAGEAGLAQPLLPLHRRLTEEEVDFVVVRVLALRHPKNVHELGLWGQRGATSRARRHPAGTGTPREPWAALPPRQAPWEDREQAQQSPVSSSPGRLHPAGCPSPPTPGARH